MRCLARHPSGRRHRRRAHRCWSVTCSFWRACSTRARRSRTQLRPAVEVRQRRLGIRVHLGGAGCPELGFRRTTAQQTDERHASSPGCLASQMESPTNTASPAAPSPSVSPRAADPDAACSARRRCCQSRRRSPRRRRSPLSWPRARPLTPTRRAPRSTRLRRSPPTAPRAPCVRRTCGHQVRHSVPCAESKALSSASAGGRPSRCGTAVPRPCQQHDGCGP